MCSVRLRLSVGNGLDRSAVYKHLQKGEQCSPTDSRKGCPYNLAECLINIVGANSVRPRTAARAVPTIQRKCLIGTVNTKQLLFEELFLCSILIFIFQRTLLLFRTLPILHIPVRLICQAHSLQILFCPLCSRRTELK